MKFITGLFLAGLFVFSIQGYGQKKNEFGFVFHFENTDKQTEDINPGAKKTSHPAWNFAFGGQYERRFTNRSSGVLGILYRKAQTDIYIPIPAGANFLDYAHFLVTENFLMLPVQYKYNLPFISLAAGASLDYFLSWKDQRKYFYAPLQSYDRFLDKKFAVGLIGGISKKIVIDQKLVFEPSVYYNRLLTFERTYYGGALEIKYRF